MIQKVFVLVAAIWLLHSSNSFAQKKIFPLQEVWEKTLQQYPSLSSKKHLIEQAEFKKQLVQKEFLPEVNMQVQQSYGSYQATPGSFFPLPGLYNNNASTKNGAIMSAGFNVHASSVLQWNLFQFGRVNKKVDLAVTGIRRSKTIFSEEAFRLQLAGTRFYFAALHHAALMNIYSEDANRLFELLDLQKTQADAGLRPGADTFLVKSAFLQAKTNVNDQHQLLQSSLLQIAALTGEDVSSFSVDTSLYHRFSIDEHDIQEIFQNHPFLDYLNSNIDYSKAELDVIKKDPYPSITLLAGTGIRGSGIDAAGFVNKNIGAPWNNNTGSYLAGIGITWNLSSLYQNKTRQHIQEAQIASDKADYQTTSLQLNTLNVTAIAGWKQQRLKTRDAKLAFEASQKAYERYTARYESGLINLIELLQLQKLLQDAEINYVNSIDSYWTQLIDQSEALGNPAFLLTAIKP